MEQDFPDNAAMRLLDKRARVILAMGLWLLSACVSHAVELHVAQAHGDDHHAVVSHTDGGASPAHSGHEHELSGTTDDPLHAPSRVQSPGAFQALALVSTAWAATSPVMSEVSASDPRPREFPPGFRSIHILRL